MMYLVEKNFIDKETKRLYKAGTVYITDDGERADQLRKNGFLGVELIAKEESTNAEDEELEKESSEKVEEPPEKEMQNNKELPEAEAKPKGKKK